MASATRSTPVPGDRVQFTLGICMLAAAAALISLFFPNDAMLAAIWLPNALVAALLLSRGSEYEAPAIGAHAIALTAAYAFAGPGGALAVLLALANLVELLIAVAAVRMLCGANPDPGDVTSLGRMVAVFLLAAAASAAIAGIAMAGGTFSSEIAGFWFLRNAASLVFIAPVTLIAANAVSPAAPSLPPPSRWLGPAIAIVLAASIGVFLTPALPAAFAITPLVVLAAVVLRIRGTAIVLTIVGVVAIVATYLGRGPLSTVADGSLRILLLQMFLCVQALVALPIAALVERGHRERAAYRRDVDARSAALDTIEEIFFTLDQSGRWTSLNAAWERMLGFAKAETIGNHFVDFLDAEDRAEAKRRLAALQAGSEEFLVMRFPVRTRDGATRHIEVRLSPIRDGQNLRNGFAGSIRDISKSQDTERQSLDHELAFETLANLAPAGIWRTDAKGRSIYSNPALNEQTGLGPTGGAGGGWADALHPEDFDRVYSGWAEAVKHRRQFVADWRWLRPDGRIVWVSTLGGPHFDAEGNLAGFIGITIDITERRVAQMELAMRESQMRAITDNIRDGLFVFDTEGTVRFASKLASKLIGRQQCELSGATSRDLFGDFAAQKIDRALAPLWNGKRETCELLFPFGAQDDDGPPRWFEGHFAVAHDHATGEPETIIGSVRDVTDAKQLEQQLRDARRLAERAAESKSSFLANMSHEIRTPMNGVLGFADLLLESDLDEKQHKQVTMIAESGQAMMRLLNDILDITRIETGNLSLTPEPLDMRHKLRSCVRLLEPVAAAKGIALDFSISDDIPALIVGDALRTRQILLNLLGNAVKFTEEGSVRADVRADGADDNRQIVIAVSDTGIGIAPEKLQLIFSEFAQGDASIGRRYGGSGLGLAISNQLAQMMGGDISVSSTPDKGSCFTLRLPLIAASEDAAASQRPIAPAEARRLAEPAVLARPRSTPVAPRYRDEPIRALVAEDHDINQELVMAMARNAGLAPDLARDGGEAVRMVREAAAAGEPYQLVLMDMQMPDVDGLEATRRLRRAGFAADELPILALTANCYADDILACRRAGMQGHLPKPLQLPALRDAIARHVSVTNKQTTARSEDALQDSGEIDADEDLSARYRRGKAELFAHLAEVASGRGEPEWDTLAAQLHKFAGTAGYFGDDELGDKARALEGQLREVEDRDVRLALVRAEWDAISSAA